MWRLFANSSVGPFRGTGEAMGAADKLINFEFVIAEESYHFKPLQNRYESKSYRKSQPPQCCLQIYCL